MHRQVRKGLKSNYNNPLLVFTGLAATCDTYANLLMRLAQGWWRCVQRILHTRPPFLSEMHHQVGIGCCIVQLLSLSAQQQVCYFEHDMLSTEYA